MAKAAQVDHGALSPRHTSSTGLPTAHAPNLPLVLSLCLVTTAAWRLAHVRLKALRAVKGWGPNEVKALPMTPWPCVLGVPMCLNPLSTHLDHQHIRSLH